MDQEKQEEAKQWIPDVLGSPDAGRQSGIRFLDHPDGGSTLTFDPEKNWGFTYRDLERIADEDEAFRKKVYDQLVKLARI